MATETLGNLRLRARERGDQVNTNQFVTDAEYNRYINASYREFYDTVLESHADHYLASPVTFTIAAGANTVPLSSFANFYRLRGLESVDGTNYTTLRRYNNQERNDVRRLSYRLMGSLIYFQPPEAAPGTYRCWYIPEPTALVADSDTVDGMNGWESWIIADVCARVAIKAEEDSAPFVRDRDRIAERIHKAAADRDEGDPEVVSDVSSQRNWDWQSRLY